ncbi:preprotein translocase subunit YajC [Nocardioides sp. HDW12B]|uniref:preprotein translocase subunit YajC n=1 Tax=Nocardioides sp. HDW12B TaxID=2714939 RepID=UPI00140996A0|nr:preprotein translocase subunit YajC [Nocardioides sp. HDW12B]QIK66640.1 preprotein translocase subunit YajC [Nocardioides sp. HDW12B]
MNGLEQLLPFVLIFLAFWLLLIRPQRKRQQELARAQGEVVIGDQVLLSAGIVGHVREAGSEFLKLEISPGAHLTVARQAVVRTLVDPVDTTDLPEDDELAHDGSAYDDTADDDTTYDGTTYEGGTDRGPDGSDPHRPTTS